MNEADYMGFAAESMAETKSRVEVDCMSQEDAGLYECVASNKKKVSAPAPASTAPREMNHFPSLLLD